MFHSSERWIDIETAVVDVVADASDGQLLKNPGLVLGKKKN